MHVVIELTLGGHPDLEVKSGGKFIMNGPHGPHLVIPNASCKMQGPPHEQVPGTHTYTISGDATLVSEDLRKALAARGGRVVWPPLGEGTQASEGLG